MILTSTVCSNIAVSPTQYLAMQSQLKNARNLSLSKKLSGYSTAEYLLVITPHEDLYNKILTLKSDFANRYNCPMAYSTKPQLTLLKFLQLEAAEERIVSRFEAVATTQPTIKIELKDFGSLPSHTIHINVTSKVPLLQLAKALKETQSLLRFDANFKPHFFSEPAITIARKLVPWQYEKAWLELSHSSFTGRFIASKMTLLKRKVGNKSYVPVKDFEFQNLPQNSMQGNLFA